MFYLNLLPVNYEPMPSFFFKLSKKSLKVLKYFNLNGVVHKPRDPVGGTE